MRLFRIALGVLASLGAGNLCVPAARGATAPEGQKLYEARCAKCHDGGVNRAPARTVLGMLGPQAIVKALTTGSMQFAGEGLVADHHASLTLFLTGRVPVSSDPNRAGSCAVSPAFGDPLEGPHWSGWGADPRNTRFQPAEASKLAVGDIPRLKLRWAVGLEGVQTAGGQPAVGGGRVFAGTRAGQVLSLDAKSGCRYWTFEAQAPVRGAIAFVEAAGRPAVAFGDQGGNLYAVDAAGGAQIWRTKLDEHPAAVLTGAPVAHGGRLYVGVSSYEEVSGGQPDYECCTFRGSVVALDIESGERLWKRYTIEQEAVETDRSRRGVQRWGPSGAGVWTAPTIDEKLGRVYVTTGDNYSDPPTDTSDAIMALDMETGDIVWTQQFTKNDAYTIACNAGQDNAACPDSRGPDVDFGSSAVLVELKGGKRVLFAGQKSGWFHVLDPDDGGKVLWQARSGTGGVLGGIQWGSATDGERAYVAVSDLGWQAIAGPGGSVAPGVNPTLGGGVMAYDLASGERKWFAPPTACDGRPGCSPGHSAAVTAIPGAVFAGSLDGHLRAYDAETGARLWDADTTGPHDTVNAVKAQGGSINGPGPVIVDGYVYVLSGYGLFGTMPGNVLLAYAVE